MIVAKIFNGYRLRMKADGATWVVCGRMRVRGQQSYVVRNESTGARASFLRDVLLSLQASGDVLVTV